MRKLPGYQRAWRSARRLGLGLGVGLGIGLALVAGATTAALADAKPKGAAPAAAALPALERYFATLSQAKLIDVETGNQAALQADVARAEALLTEGATLEAAVAFYTIVVSPRYAALTDALAYQNAEYDLGIALLRAGAYGEASEALARVLRRGPAAKYWGPAHRRRVDIAIETRDFAGAHAALVALDGAAVPGGLPAEAIGERNYLLGRAAYGSSDWPGAERHLAQVSKQSRLYPSSLYLRGVLAARQGKYRQSAVALCEAAAHPSDGHIAFIVDDRYFTIRDLARLGLGRIAHEQRYYDDAYYHYFQIPNDSTYLAEALFEAAWAMYQKRELGTARDLTAEFLASFPSSPLWPEATLLAGYVELADCKFDRSQTVYDDLITKLGPLVTELDRLRKDPTLAQGLFAQAVTRWRTVRTAGDSQGKTLATARALTTREQVLSLLRIDPMFLRLSDTATGVTRVAGETEGVVASWKQLRGSLQATKVQGNSEAATAGISDEDELARNIEKLTALVEASQRELAAGKQTGAVPADVASRESATLADAERKLAALQAKVRAAGQQPADPLTGTLTGAGGAGGAGGATELASLVDQDLRHARQLDAEAAALRRNVHAKAKQLANASIERLYHDTKRVLDKAKLGKIDAVIGQKRKLDIDVQDLAAGRFPPELIKRLWSMGLIGDDEEVWPIEADYWADEYEGWR